MKTNDGFERFGSAQEFALDLQLESDPDGDNGAPLTSVGSWGRWRLWVAGNNLCEYDLTQDHGDVVRCDAVTWYLAPLIRWLAVNWDPLLHEERLPLQQRSSAMSAATARHTYISAIETTADDVDRFEPWQEWASRHSLRWAAEGGLVPDIFIRRLGDDIEVSWGDRWQPGGEAAQFVLDEGCAYPSAAAASQALDEALRWFLARPELIHWPWMAEIRTAVDSRTRPNAQETRLAWHIDGAGVRGRLTELFLNLRAEYAVSWQGVFADMADSVCLTRLSPAAAMFGALSPDLSTDAATRLLAITADALDRGAVLQAPATVEQYRQREPIRLGSSIWAQGYGLAQTFIEEAEALPGQENDDPFSINLDALLGRMGVVIRTEALGVRGPRGVALAGEGLAATIVVNSDHPMNENVPGQRFTIAHELCHILYDRDRARRVTHVSTPWAPRAVEQRANAFAAMMLMPPELIRRAAPALSDEVDLDTIASIASTMKVSLRALIAHLANAGEIDEEARERLLAEFERRLRQRF